jgi:hypothetical protein
VSIGPNHRDNHGERPLVPPHVLGRLLDKLKPMALRIRREQNARSFWLGIDRMADSMEAAR